MELPTDIELSSRLKNILIEFTNVLERRKEFELEFNIFSLVSDTYHKENFHSEIISKLLDPKGKHNEKAIFFELFIDFLYNLGCAVDKNDYLTDEISVIKEKPIDAQRRIDILISTKNHAIIIENKINDAVDMNNQLVDYYKYCLNNNLIVDAILYLSLDGCKLPDRNKWTMSDQQYFEAILSKLQTISAFDIRRPERAVYSWLESCCNAKISENSKFILIQYKQLLKSLRGYIMETNVLEKYYEWISINQEKLKDLEEWSNIHKNLTRYYPSKLKTQIDIFNTNQYYFRNCNLWRDDELIFSNIGDDNNHYLKVAFISNTRCEIRLMNNSGNWVYDEIFKSNDQFLSLFIEEDDDWFFKRTEYNFINDFNTFTEDIKKTLDIIAKIIRNIRKD